MGERLSPRLARCYLPHHNVLTRGPRRVHTGGSVSVRAIAAVNFPSELQLQSRAAQCEADS